MKCTYSLLIFCCLATQALHSEDEQAAPEMTMMPVDLPVVATEQAQLEPVDQMAAVAVVVQEVAMDQPMMEVAAPAAEAPATVVPAAVVPVVEAMPLVIASLPTEKDIDKIARVIAANRVYADAMAHVKDAISLDVASEVIDESLVRSLLNLLAIHKKEEAAIGHLRDSISSLRAMLNSWEEDVDALLKEKDICQGKKQQEKQNKKNKNKENTNANANLNANQNRDIDFSIVKDQAGKPRPQK